MSALSLPDTQQRSKSVSLPPASHPNCLPIEAKLQKLKFWEASSLATIGSSAAETLQVGMTDLTELYSFMEEFIQSPIVQQTLFHNRHEKLVEDLLDMSVTLLDLSSSVKDLFMITKEHAQVLQLGLRRSGDSTTDTSVKAYICFRKKAKKDTAKCLRTLKQMENKIGSCPRTKLHHYPSVVFRTLGELTASTICILKSLLLYLSVPAMMTKASGWSLVSKLIHKEPLASPSGQQSLNEVWSADFAVFALNGRIRRSNNDLVDVKTTQKKLQTLDICIQDIEAGLACLNRRLIQNRVSLLNTLTV